MRAYPGRHRTGQRSAGAACWASGTLTDMTVGLPFTPTAQRLSAELLSDVPARWGHVQGVARRTNEIAEGLSASARDLVTAAAWLHDIGYSGTLTTTGMHALDGALHLAQLGWPTTIVGLVAFHTGADHEADERGLAQELDCFTRPPQGLLDILTAADLSTGPEGHRVPAMGRIAEILERYEPADPVHRAVVRSRTELLEAVGRASRAWNQPT